MIGELQCYLPMADDLPELTVADADAWSEWLGEHHDSPRGVWLVLAKKGTTRPTSLTYGQALEVALCHGWIDGSDGRWEKAYAGQASIEEPPDLTAALSAAPRAQAMFDILTSQNRYAILYRIESAKRPDTRARRIEQFVAMLARGETVYPQRRSLDD